MLVPSVEDLVSQVDEDTAHHQREKDRNQNICCNHVLKRHIKSNEDSEKTEPHKVCDDNFFLRVEPVCDLRKSFYFT